MGRLPADRIRDGLFAVVWIALVSTVTACSVTQGARTAAQEARPAAEVPTGLWRLPQEADALYAASCPKDAGIVQPEPISLDSTRVPGENAGAFGELPGVELSGLTFVAGYHLTSDDPRFGGLSGLAAPRWGSLLAVADQGDFVWIELDEKTAAAPLSASMATMRGADGQPLSGKKNQDAEGLALRDGLALVSFERNHRVAAFDIETCAAAARAAPVMQLDQSINLPRVDENGGAEALALSPEGGLILGLETADKGEAPLSIAPPAGLADFSTRLDQPRDHRMTGADFFQTSETSGVLFSLHRAYNPLSGARIALLASAAKAGEAGWSLEAPQTLLTLAQPGPTDNFEGVAAIANPEGGARLYIISDDNFSNTQRTLLYIFDVN